MPPEAVEPTFAELLWNPTMYWFWAGICFFYGLFIGSFLNVAIYRIPVGMSVNRPKRSFCYRCGTMIPWHQNLPVISYLLLRGKCGSCGAGFSPRYAGVELLTGLIFLAVFLGNNSAALPFQFATVWYVAFAALLIVGTFTDFDHWIIPDGVTVGGGIASIVAAFIIGFVDDWPLLRLFGPFPIVRHYGFDDPFNLFVMVLQGPLRVGLEPEAIRWWDTLANGLLGAVFGFGLIYSIGVAGKVMLGKDAMGFGDVKLFAMIGGTLGIVGVLVTLFAACVFGAAAGMAGMAVAALRQRTAPKPGILTAGAPSGEADTVFEVSADDTEPQDTTTLADRIGQLGREINRGPTVHHLPFGPWISMGALLVLIFQAWIREGIAQWIF